MTIFGGCHCRAVRFSASLDPNSVLLACNCSICSMCGFLHLIVPHSEFKLLSGQDALSSYRFNTGQAEHLFCRHCGIKSYYQPRSHPNAWSINAHCLDDFDLSAWTVQAFDGRNWREASTGL